MLPTIPKRYFEVKNKSLPRGKATFYPFTVAQEQVLLEIKDSKNRKDIILAIKQIVEECNKEKDEFDKVPAFVLEYIFLKIYEKSIGEFINLVYKCNKKYGESICDGRINADIDIREFILKEYKEHTNKIMISDKIGIKFNYPTYESYSEADIEDNMEDLISCIESIFDEDNIYDPQDSSREELESFWNEIELIYKKDIIEKYWVTLPHIHFNKKYKCSKCGFEHTIEFNGLQELFT